MKKGNLFYLLLSAVLAAGLLPLLGGGFYMAAAAKDAVLRETFDRLQTQNQAVSALPMRSAAIGGNWAARSWTE